MKKPAFVGRAKSVANTILSQKSLSVMDFNVASFHLELLHKSEEDTEVRAISYKGGGLYPKECKFSEFKSNFNLEGRGVYFVVNDGGTKDIEITLCRAFFVEWDDRPKKDQLYIYKELNLPEPTFQLDTGGKSIHCYWVLNKPVSQLIWQPIQKRLTDYCNADKNNVNPSRVMRLAGFYYINKEGKATEKSRLINISQKEYSVKDFEQVLPEPEKPKPVEIKRQSKSITQSNWTIDDLAEALKYIPQRPVGCNTYDFYRNIAWSVKAWCIDLGYSEQTAIDIMEAHSPSASCDWGIPQIIKKGGGKISAGTLIHEAQKRGWRPKTK